jgi:crotonobetainyl-CoA:carnitine CoA-transferase CaiB-like acyl-CoA transferase
MTLQPMQGVRVLEVAQFTFTPSAAAILADWGAEVIKVEHAEMGDAQRGIKFGSGGVAQGSFHPLMEHSNRGKRSIGLALDVPEGRAVLDEIISRCDVFVTNFLPDSRARLRIDVDDVRSVNSSVIYARGTAHGTQGAEAARGGYDRSTFWARGGSAMGCTPPDSPRVIDMPSGAYGDSLGGLALASGISAALFARERTGEPSVVDVSLLGIAAWASAMAIDNALLVGHAAQALPLRSSGALPGNPTTGYFQTSDGRWIVLSILQPGRYWEDLCKHIGLDHLIGDERFDTGLKLIENGAEAGAAVAEAFAAKPYAYWIEQLQTMQGQWAPVQDAFEVGHDPQIRANGIVRPVVDADGVDRELVANPVQYDQRPPDLVRAPQFAEHTDEILRECGHDDEKIIALKFAGAVT